MSIYHAFHYGKMNQSFKMEDEYNNSLYEANLIAFKLLSASEYEFINRISAASSVHKIGKTTSIERGSEGISLTTASWFKLDGKNCYDALEEKGYHIKIASMGEIIHPEFALVDMAGNQAAVYKMNVPGEKEADVIAVGNKQSNTVITTECNDLEAVFLGAFILGRVDFSLCLV